MKLEREGVPEAHEVQAARGLQRVPAQGDLMGTSGIAGAMGGWRGCQNMEYRCVLIYVLTSLRASQKGAEGLGRLPISIPNTKLCQK